MLSNDVFSDFADAALALWPRLDLAVSLPDAAGWLRPDSTDGRWARLGGLDSAGLARLAPELWARALRGGCGIHWRPAPDGDGSWRYVLLDDLAKSAAFAVARRYRCILIETSSGSIQAVLRLARPVSRLEQHQIQAALVARLLAAGRHADRGATGAGQFARAPGFPHPGHAGRVVELVGTPGGGQTDLDPDQLLTGDSSMPAERSEGRASPCSPRGPQAPRSGARGKGAGSVRPVAQSASEADFRLACTGIRRGADPDSIIAKIAESALSRGKRRTDAEAASYAERTYAAALARVRAA